MQPKSQTSFLDPEEKSADSALRRVSVLVPLPVGKTYDYAVPEGKKYLPGQYVRVPLGNREVIGVVWDPEPGEKRPDSARLKLVLESYDLPPMPENHRRFIDWMARYTMAPPGAILKMAVSVPAAFTPPKPVPVYCLPGGNLPEGISLTPQRQKIVDVLKRGHKLRAAELARMAGCSVAVVRGLAEAGVLASENMFPPPPCVRPDAARPGPVLSEDQQNAADALVAAVTAETYSATLLDGVTGAGKTEVYFEAARAALEKGRQVLVLLPEIALSQQFMERFKDRFGVAPALWHSEVPQARRRETWRGIVTGETKFVVGARSALFLPFHDLGLIVVDEEHDTSYKQEEGVIYHARDMAVARAHQAQIPIVLVSATPSLETVVNVRQGRYQDLRLRSRHGGAVLPQIHVIDLRKDVPGRQQFLSPVLKEALKLTFEAGEQSLLFLNRRGYAPLTLCRKCGHRFKCPSCTAWLVEHKRTQKLHCHHCGYDTAAPDICPTCGAEESLSACGPGIERIAEEVKTFLPAARLLLMASDLVAGPAALHQAIQAIADHQVDVIIGTQIIAKGHHFPSLTCVGVVDADLGLEGGDLRASERTFQLLHQVSGRAGRASKAGHVYVQSYMPENRVIAALATQDREAFFEVEIEERKRAEIPPFGRMASVIVSGADEALVDKVAQDLGRAAPRMEGVKILGPAPAALAVLRNKHRRRLLIKTAKDVSLQGVIEQWLGKFKTPSKIQIKVDIDPQSFL